jgi:hypothetical protein
MERAPDDVGAGLRRRELAGNGAQRGKPALPVGGVGRQAADGGLGKIGAGDGVQTTDGAACLWRHPGAGQQIAARGVTALLAEPAGVLPGTRFEGDCGHMAHGRSEKLKSANSHRDRSLRRLALAAAHGAYPRKGKVPIGLNQMGNGS